MYTGQVEYRGGAAAVLGRARHDFEAGDYRWVAQVCHHLVFAAPANRPAREPFADALEQIGDQSEDSTWPNAYPVPYTHLTPPANRKGESTLGRCGGQKKKGKQKRRINPPHD